MRVLVIGATGFIGSHTVKLLTMQGHEVAVFHRSKKDTCFPYAKHFFGDRNSLEEILPELKHFKPEVVLDIIPYTDKQAQGLIDAFRGVASRVIAISSADVYRNYEGFCRKATAPPDPVPLLEDAPLRRTRYPYRGYEIPFDWAHDYDKILVERILLNNPDLPSTILRLPAVYGPGDKQHRIWPYLMRMDDGRPVVLLEKQQAAWRWTRGFVENVAAAIALAVTDDRATGRVYNLGEEPAPTEREWVEQIGKAAGWSGKVVAVSSKRLPEHLHQPFDFSYDLAIDTRSIRDELGYTEPVESRVALQRTVEWERSEPHEPGQPDYAAEDAALSYE